ncbi:MAG TPA: hypothetical protein VE172_01120 [Stackebrandtia sp.]|jgi:TRAP-type C4-dicarboxylate transport system permease small subunit|uniref:hypothetical protein n=1 Tax=Stackebrandtia sp. TaxID=2023065 RepID=UPI002D421C8F|nr:hypothetical protein [Stackebrandtia sp.]HZE37390.1 hypothetical protein [Stackebrandtia sp.]
MDKFYVLIGAGMLVAAIVWYVSPRSRRRIRRLAVAAALIALLLAVGYDYAHRDDAAPSPAVDVPMSTGR